MFILAILAAAASAALFAIGIFGEFDNA